MSRRYRGCDIEAGAVRVYMGFGRDGALVPGWVATCPGCGLEMSASTQSVLRDRITAHKWYGKPVHCEATS